MTCECPSACKAKTPHAPDKCKRKRKWYLEFHAVDDCLDTEPRRIEVCQTCFDSHVEVANRVIDGGWKGLRALVCMSCERPLTRLSTIIGDVARV